MLIPLLKSLGWTLAHTPKFILQLLACVLGEILFIVRRRTYLSNLSHAFPERDITQHKQIARESARRLVETGLLTLATPYLSETQIFKIARPSAGIIRILEQQRTSPVPTLLLTPHIAYWEAFLGLRLVTTQPGPEIAAIFRPADNPKLNAWIKQCRERFGIRLLSRKDGFQEALKLLRHNGCLFLLYDQNAGLQGALSTLFGRVCSTTELAGLLAQKFSANVYMVHAERQDLWRVELHAEALASDGTMAGVTLAINRWLEDKLTHSVNICSSWLWAHERWKNQDIPAKRLRLEAKRNLIPEDLVARNLTRLPRRTRLWIRVPNWLGDVVMLLPLLRAVRRGRPDAEITLIAKPGFHDLLILHGEADRVIDLPPKGPGYFSHFWRLRTHYPDFYLLFTNSVRGDFESWLTGTPQRFGLERPRKRRPLLTHSFKVPADFDETVHHQLELWTRFLQHFGLNEAADPTPLATSSPGEDLVIGMITGSENNPEKRWPIAHWCSLIRLLPRSAKVVLFGTSTDRGITDEITARCERPVENLAGRTTLPEYCDHLGRCTVLVTNDTGGMHLANALGVPLIALFGPTNPVRTRPVFSAPVTILQPPGCPPTGGGDLANLSPDQVLGALRDLHPGRITTV